MHLISSAVKKMFYLGIIASYLLRQHENDIFSRFINNFCDMLDAILWWISVYTNVLIIFLFVWPVKIISLIFNQVNG